MRKLGKIPFVCHFVALLFVAELLAILVLNRGTFTYSLDDPYIHLALAEQLVHGHYGLHPQAVSAPSSSVLWPFVLTPFCAVFGGGAVLVPLLLNMVGALAAVCVLSRILARLMERQALLQPLLCFFVLALNLVGLVFTGMEHVFQLLAALSVFYGLVVMLQDGRMTGWLWGGVLIGPMVRYENLAVSASACLVLWMVARRKAAVLLAAGALVPLLAFSLFLHQQGLGWMPSSVLAKSGVVAEAGSWDQVFLNLKRNVLEKRGRGLLFLVSGGLLAAAVLRRKGSKEQRLTALYALGVVAAHLLAGSMGWFSRYEVYAWGTALCGLMSAYRQLILQWAARLNRGMAWAVCGAAAILLCPAYVYALLMTPLGCSNVYEQQYQMRRFVTEFWRQPVAANDIGYISYRNSTYVLDIGGLGSYEALKMRRAEDTGWMQRWVPASGVRLAIIYPREAPPASWTLVASLHLAHRRTTVAAPVVGFYALDDDTAVLAGTKLRAFAHTLPPGVRLVMSDGYGRNWVAR